MLLESFTFYLRFKGFEVYPASNGAAAWKQYQRCREEGRPIDLIITDMDMPVMSGEELIGAVRSTEKYFPILAMTNSLSVHEIARMKRFGNIEFIEKPFRLSALHTHLEMLLRGGRHAHEVNMAQCVAHMYE
jgi:DNA-binding response OmpR family regulator